MSLKTLAILNRAIHLFPLAFVTSHHGHLCMCHFLYTFKLQLCPLYNAAPALALYNTHFPPHSLLFFYYPGHWRPPAPPKHSYLHTNLQGIMKSALFWDFMQQ